MDPKSVGALRQIHFFKDLPDELLNAIAAASETTTAELGSVIVSEGAPSDALYLIRTGSVRVSKGDGSDVLMLGSGSHFGEMGLVDNSKRTATVTATEHCELIVVPADRLTERLERTPALAMHFYKAMARSLARRLRNTTDDLGFARQYMREH